MDDEKKLTDQTQAVQDHCTLRNRLVTDLENWTAPRIRADVRAEDTSQGRSFKYVSWHAVQ